MKFLFIRGSNTEMLQTCTIFPLFSFDDNIILIHHIFM